MDENLVIMLIVFLATITTCVIGITISNYRMRQFFLTLSDIKDEMPEFESYIQDYKVAADIRKENFITLPIRIKHKYQFYNEKHMLAINGGRYYWGKFEDNVIAMINLTDKVPLSFHIVDENYKIICHFFSAKEGGELFDSCSKITILLLPVHDEINGGYEISYTPKIAVESNMKCNS